MIFECIVKSIILLLSVQFVAINHKQTVEFVHSTNLHVSKEFALRRCGSYLAARENIRMARQFVDRFAPEYEAERHINLSQRSREACSDLSNISLHHQHNPRYHLSLPNVIYQIIH